MLQRVIVISEKKKMTFIFFFAFKETLLNKLLILMATNY